MPYNYARGRFLEKRRKSDKVRKDFIYRLEGYWWVFVVAVLLTGLIAFVSVIWQVLKAAKTNPATELKKE